jgi:REP element-mobilizing transposase RayT
VAVKQIPMLHKEVPTQDWQKLLQEAAVMAKASERCKFSCRLLGICLMPDHICLVMKLQKFPGIKKILFKLYEFILILKSCSCQQAQ